MSGKDVEYIVDAREWIYAIRQMGKFADGQDLDDPIGKVRKLLYEDVEYSSSNPTRRSYDRTFRLLDGWGDTFGGRAGVLLSFHNSGVPYARRVMSAKDQAPIHRPSIYWGDRTIEKTGERVADDVPEIFDLHFAKYVDPRGKV